MNLSEVLGLQSREHLLGLLEVGNHGDDVIADIAKIQGNLRRRGVGDIAVPRKGADDIDLVVQRLTNIHDLLAQFEDALQGESHVVRSSDGDRVFHGYNTIFNTTDERGKAVNDIIAARHQ